MPTITLSLTSHLAWVHQDGSTWIPTGDPDTPGSSFKYQWAYATFPSDHLGPNYGVGGVAFDLAATIGQPYAIDSIAYSLSGTLSSNSTIPAICLDSATIASHDPDDIYGAVTGTLLSIGGLSAGSVTRSGTLAVDALDGVGGLRAGFDSATAPVLLVPLPDAIGQFADFDGTFSITITYHLLCIEPGPLVQSAITCIDADGTDNSVAIDCLLLEQLADDYGITPFEDTASVKGTDQRAVLWFETCVLEHQFDSVTQIILALDISYILRDPCNPTVRGYFTSQYAPSGELQPAIDDLDGTYYISPEGQTAFDPISAWALGRDTMIETSPDHEWLGPARVLIELAERDMIFHSRMTGIVITGDFSDGIGQVDVLGSSQLLVCGALNPANDDTPPDDTSQPGGNDDTPDDGDPGDDSGDGGGDDGSKDGSEDKPQGASKGERPQVTSQIAQPYQRPVPAKIHVLVTFLARLRRDGQVDEGG